MPTVPENAPSSTATSNGVDCEPDDAWKENLRKRIEEGLQSMVADAKENHATELSKAPDTPEARMHLEAEYSEAMQTIKSLALEQYKLELGRERNQRRWTAGVPMTPGWSQIFRQEQQNIMNSIKQSNQTDNSVRTASESPTEERRSSIPKPSNDPPALAPTPVLVPVPPSPSVRPTEEREKFFVSPQSVRRGSDVRSTLSGDRDDLGSFGRSHHASVHVRPSLPENWTATQTVEEPEEFIRSPPPRARLSSIDNPSQPSPLSPDVRWDSSSLGRSSGSIHSSEPRSPPRVPPEVWKPPAEDVLPKPYNLGRRGSSASMRSTGSGASIRPSITETIPERTDDGPDESDIDYERAQETTEQGRAWISTDKSRNKEKRPPPRRKSRQSTVDAGLRSDDLGSSTGLRSDDRHRPIDSPVKPPPYYDHRERSSSRDGYAHRDQQVPSQDPRPIPARSSYGGDDRDYIPQYSTPHRPHGPPPYHLQRESRPISRQVSFNRQPHIDLDDINDERDIDRGGRDRERHWDREYDRDRDWDGGRDLHSDPRRSTPYYSASRHSSYPNPSIPGGSSRPAPQDYDVYEEWEGAPGSSLGRYNNYRGPPPDNLEYQRRPDSARSGPGLSRQSSYVRPRDEPDRRFTGDNDGYSRHFSSAGGGIPIPRHTPSFEEPLAQQPAWTEWATEGNRHLNYHQQAQSPRSPPPNSESFPPPRRFTHPPKSYPKSSPHDDRSPSFSGRETESSQHRGGRSTATDEYDSADEDTDSEEEEDDDDDDNDDDDDDDDDDGDGDGDVDVDDDSSEEGAEAKRLRDLEARKQKLEENKREADDELKKTELEIQQLDARKKKEDEERREEARRKEEEAWRREEDARKKDEEIQRMKEEVKRKEEDAARKEEEVKRKEADAVRKAEEAKKLGEIAKKKEAEAKKKEKEARAKEQDAKKKEEIAKQKVEEARQKAEELSRKEEEARQREAQLEQDTEKTKQMQLETQKIAEDLKKKEEEAHRKDLEMKEREDLLQRREEELMRREADNLRREEEVKKKQEAARKEEELKEKVRKDEEAKQEAARKEEELKEKVRKDEEAKQAAVRRKEAREEEVKREAARKREEAFQEVEREEAKKKAAEAKREEDKMKRKLQVEEAKHKAEEATKRREEDLRREEARLEDFRRDPNFMDVQVKVLQQAEFRKKEEDIRRTREERKRNDSVSNDSAWSNSSYLSNSPGTSPSMSRSPQFNAPPISERGTGPSTGGRGAGAPAWGPSPSMKPTAASSSPTTSRPSASTSTGKPRTGSVSSGTYPTSSSPNTASFSEAERTRKQQEFAESQQEQFRRAQEKMEAERQLKSAGRPLSRDELKRVFDHHERLWTRLNTLDELSWNDFPWPMARQPSNPDDMSLLQISSYIQSPLYPDKDKSKTPKDRIKEHIKRWHPDRFETKLLPKVVEDERETVKHGAGNVARYLSDLLRKENESNNNNIFGD